MSWRLDGKIALVTGGSKGIGFAAAQELGDLGASVFISARNLANLESAVQKLKARSISVEAIVADSTKVEGREKLLATIAAKGGLDILVNNSGGGMRTSLLESGHGQWTELLERNVIAAAELSRLFHPLLKASRCGSIIHVSSVAASLSVRDLPIYGSAKAALSQLTRVQAVDWAGDGIRVNAVAPWFTKTPANGRISDYPQIVESIHQRTPMGRFAEASEVGSVVAFLASPGASYVSGQVITVDGAMSALAI